jgi:hypothetical protein
LIALDGELGRTAATVATGTSTGVPTWVDAGKEWLNDPTMNKAEGAGLEELVGSREAAAISARGRRRKQRSPGGEGDDNEGKQPYEVLAKIHHDQGIQRYLTVSHTFLILSLSLAYRIIWRPFFAL